MCLWFYMYILPLPITNQLHRFYITNACICLFCSFKFVAPLFKSLHTLLTEKDLPPLVVYSNRGEIFDAEKAEWTGREKCIAMETYVPEWIRLGATIIGGCCRVYPSDILAIRKCVDSIGNNNNDMFSNVQKK